MENLNGIKLSIRGPAEKTGNGQPRDGRVDYVERLGILHVSRNGKTAGLQPIPPDSGWFITIWESTLKKIAATVGAR
jgi:hypothetical protein